MKKLSPAFNKVTVTPREVFQIELPAMTSAGDKWSLDIDGEGTLLSEKTILPKGNLIGGQVTQVFSIVADKVGEIRVSATYSRPWEKAAPAKTETFTIAVK